MPPLSSLVLHLAFVTRSLVLNMPSRQHITNNRLNIPSFRDDAIKEYCAWQQLQVKELALKAKYNIAYNIILNEGINLKLICKDLNLNFLVKRGVKRGIAKQVVRDIDY
jgi:hypothetical protein